MDKTLNLQKHLIIFGLPILIIGTMIILAKSSIFYEYPKDLSTGITFDLLLTVPLLYFLLIRKTNIPKTTVIPLLIVGLIICSSILPIENQYYLNLFKTWALPVIELTVFTYFIYNIRKGIKHYKQNKKVTNDFFTSLKQMCSAILPKGLAVFFAFEIATIYYGFIYWRKRNIKNGEFSYHKNSATISTLVAFILVICIETVVFHLLLANWSSIVAWTFTFLSIYTAIQLFGFLKSLMKRPISITDGKLHLYYGIMNETVIDIKQIETIEITSKEIDYNKGTKKFSFLDSPNIMIKLKKEGTLNGLYGMKRKFSAIGVYVDKPTEFNNALQQWL
ncbi:hypothetical protein [Ulvibacterium sp.]|uniref:hypothetical protein n=1 Tax=Ulvibacterium sp. TaxID=2665914 RepID=UPI0026324058|nr:hypothetical protein [Ulvibacterium sp.]